MTILRYGKISTQTSKRGKVRISQGGGGGGSGGVEEGEVDSEDDFEADMVKELQERVQVFVVSLAHQRFFCFVCFVCCSVS